MSDRPARPRPAGSPIGQALLLPPDPVGSAFRVAVDAVDRVHGDGVLPQIAIVPIPGFMEEACYEVIPSTGEPLWIAVNPSPRHPGLSLLHEIGHLLDHLGIGQPTVFSSPTALACAAWREKMILSDAVKTLEDLEREARTPEARGYLRYLLEYHELWARSYAQFVTTLSEDPVLVTQLNERRRWMAGTTYVPQQWNDADFLPIADAIADLFRNQGWIA